MIDTHSHLFVEEFNEDLSEVIARAQEAGVTHVFMPNIDDTTVEDMLRVCAEHPGYCYPMLGYHPTSVDGDVMHKVRKMKERLVEGHPYIAIGEVGLDLYWDKTWLKQQELVLDEQIQWALEWNLPLVIHCREAFPELFRVLAPYKDTALRGVFHSFTGTADEAVELMQIPVDGQFHRAFEDAEYTGKVMRKMDFDKIAEYISVDYYNLRRLPCSVPCLEKVQRAGMPPRSVNLFSLPST